MDINNKILGYLLKTEEQRNSLNSLIRRWRQLGMKVREELIKYLRNINSEIECIIISDNEEIKISGIYDNEVIDEEGFKHFLEDFSDINLVTLYEAIQNKLEE